MHSCLGNWVAIGHAVVYFAQTALAFSAGIKCRHCKTYVTVRFSLTLPMLRLLVSKEHGDKHF